MTAPTPIALRGVDFSSAPSARKPITVAHGRRRGGALRLERIDALPTLADFEASLTEPGPWFGGFDFPFGLPRVFVDALALGDRAADVIAELRRRCPTRRALQATIDGWGNGRPAGARLPHRACDGAMPGHSTTSPLQTRYVPVGFMYYEGLSRLIAAGVHLPGLHDADPARVAVEAYPGWLAGELIGRRSYKNGADAQRREARQHIVERLERGDTRLALRLQLTAAWRERLLDDAAGDHLDAVLALMQAAWAERRPDLGLPARMDPVEGWIAGAPM